MNKQCSPQTPCLAHGANLLIICSDGLWYMNNFNVYVGWVAEDLAL